MRKAHCCSKRIRWYSKVLFDWQVASQRRLQNMPPQRFIV
jgi:hypothetical protein